ncbi:astacin [Teladorsagia circumcincta]|uniref:Astacin n=1 Tax=Teladorsagia circumcincta TaxID=45464 RepID=A0A2G9TYN7_TELCI|nr:astacin [Teladorsagia circumcincta]
MCIASAKDYLVVYGGAQEGCSSYVGRLEDPGMQIITLGRGCGTEDRGEQSYFQPICDGTHVMIPKDANYTETLGSDLISFYDLLMMNKLYNCNDACKEQSAQCHNEGFPHPRDCSKCICPSGYGGQPEGCGETLQAKETWQSFEYSLDGSSAKEERDGYKKCNYWITAPESKIIEVKILKLPSTYPVDGCKYAGVEIKARPDKRLTGYRWKEKNEAAGPA